MLLKIVELLKCPDYSRLESVPTNTLSTHQLKLVSDLVCEPSLLVHFTNAHASILSNGLMGVQDVRRLGLTKNQPVQKLLNGYNFAYPALSKGALTQQ